MRTRRIFLFAALAASASALAGSVYLNNVNIDGVTNQKFDKATVRLDEKGNVYIDAPGYAVKAVEVGSAPKGANAAEPSNLSHHYWLVTEQAQPGMTDFDIDVYVNSKWIRKLKSADEQIVMELTRHMVLGKNSVLLTAHKTASGASRSSTKPEHLFRVIIGEGNVGGDNVMIDNPVVRFERSAAEPADVSQEYELEAR